MSSLRACDRCGRSEDVTTARSSGWLYIAFAPSIPYGSPEWPKDLCPYCGEQLKDFMAGAPVSR